MPLETSVSTFPTTSDFLSATSGVLDQSGKSYDSPRWLSSGTGSLATSSDAAYLQRSMWEIADRLFLMRPPEIASEMIEAVTLFPACVDVSFVGQPDVRQSVDENRSRARLISALHSSFEADPLEDGMYHPAEEIIVEALHSEENLHVLEWLRAVCLDAARPSFAASVLRCLGRQTEPGTNSWRAELVGAALAINDLEIRDAAVQAVESWEDPELIDLLESHSEPVTWLRDYIHDVIDDLRQ